MFWVTLVWTIALYGGILLAGWLVYTNGVEETVRALVNWGKYVSEYWLEQYRQYDGHVASHGSAGTGYGYSNGRGVSR